MNISNAELNIIILSAVITGICTGLSAVIVFIFTSWCKNVIERHNALYDCLERLSTFFLFNANIITNAFSEDELTNEILKIKNSIRENYSELKIKYRRVHKWYSFKIPNVYEIDHLCKNLLYLSNVSYSHNTLNERLQGFNKIQNILKKYI